MEVVVNRRSCGLALSGILFLAAAGCGGRTGASLSTSSSAPSPSQTIRERPTPRLTRALTGTPSPLPPTPVTPTPPARPGTLPPAGSPALVIREGHHLINHTYDHASMTGATTKTAPLTREQRWEELDRTEAIVMQLTGATTKPYFRPPYGAYDASVNEDVGARGYAYNVLWTVDSRGWMGWSAGAIIQRCLEQAEPGAIYVFHVGSGSQDGPALQAIIDGLRAQGYFIGSVPDVLPS